MAMRRPIPWARFIIPVNTRERLEKGQLRQVRPRGPILRFRWNPEQMTPGGGVGGWAEMPRPQNTAAVEWEGLPARTVTFSLLLDGWEEDRSVEKDIRTLRRMGEPRGRRRPPPELELRYGTMGRGHTWVIGDLAWGDELRNKQLQRVRQEVTVTLTEYVEAEVTLRPTDRHKDRKQAKDADEGKGKGGGRNRVVQVKKGDTLSSLAAKHLGRAGAWTDLAELNGLRDPQRLTVGQRIRLPEG